MLCNLCSKIDLDQLSAPQGYKHHSSCAALLQSAQNGCQSCKLISDTHWADVGGDLASKHDQGSLDTQIIARTVNQKPGQYNKIRFGQETRSNHHQSKLMTEYTPVPHEDAPPKIHPLPELPFLWSFVMVAANPGMHHILAHCLMFGPC
jgi:hypothetical protein